MPTPICSRCGQPATDSGMRLVGLPLGDRGPRLVGTVLCSPDCTAALQVWLAAPLLPAECLPPESWPPRAGRSAEAADLAGARG